MNIETVAPRGQSQPTVDLWARRRRDETFDLRAIVGALSYRRWLVAGVGFVLAALAALVALQLPDRYTATTQLMLNGREVKVIDIDSVIASLPADARMIEGEIAVILSNETLFNVIVDLDLLKDPEFNAALEQSPAAGLAGLLSRLGDLFAGDDAADAAGREGLTPEQINTIKALRRQLEISQVGLSLVIAVTASASEPAKAAAIANAVARRYIDNQLAQKAETTRAAAEWLRGRAQALRGRLEQSEGAVETFRIGMTAGDGRTLEVLNQQLSELASRAILAQVARAEIEARAAESQRRLSEDGFEAARPLLSTATLDYLSRELDNLRGERAALVATVGPANRALVEIDGRIAAMEARLEDAVRRAVDAMSGERDAARAVEAGASAALGAVEAAIRDQSSSMLRLRQLERIAEADRKIYETFLLRLNELSEQAGFQQADARIVSSAVPPDLSAGPNRKLIVAAAGVLGVMIGAALALALSASASTFGTDVDLRDRLGLRTLGRVPRVPGQKAAADLVELVRRRPFDPLAQSVRGVMAALIEAPGLTSRAVGRRLVIASAGPREGRTTLCLLLADVAARMGRRAIVVDADFRNPSVGRMLGAAPGPDLVDLLSDGGDPAGAIRVDPQFGVAHLPVLDAARARPELLYTDGFARILDRLAEQYDFVIVDTGPLAAGVDMCAVARDADFVLVAIKWRRTTEPQVETAVSRLFQAGARRVGAVLTFVDRAGEARYRRRAYNLKNV